jgi:hypothetical protein
MFCSGIFHLYRDITIAGEGLQNFMFMLCTPVLWASRDLYCATPTVTQDLGSSSALLMIHKGKQRIYSNQDPNAIVYQIENHWIKTRVLKMEPLNWEGAVSLFHSKQEHR